MGSGKRRSWVRSPKGRVWWGIGACILTSCVIGGLGTPWENLLDSGVDTGERDTGGEGSETPGWVVPPGVDCAGDYLTVPPGSFGLPECQTAEIACGETVFGRTSGGSEFYSREHYELGGQTGTSWGGCAGGGSASTSTDFDAPERVYSFVQPVGVDVRVEVAACEGLYLKVVYGLGDEACPAADDGSVVLGCDSARFEADGSQVVELSGSGVERSYELVVDGANQAVGNYAVTVSCTER